MPQHTGRFISKSLSTTLIAFSVALLDYVTKSIIEARVPLYDSISVLPFLNIVHVQNRGAAFSMFTSLGNNFFIVISCVAIVVIVLYIAKTPKGMEHWAMSLILGGAAGNLIDRIRIGQVVDFIDVYVKSYHWPAFNVADSALTIGIVLFLFANIRQGQSRKQKSNS